MSIIYAPVAASIGIKTPNYKALLLGAKTSVIQAKLKRAATEALHRRRAVEIRQAQRALEDREITLEKRADMLAEVDQALDLALLKAGREKERADRLAKNVNTLTIALFDAGVAMAPHGGAL
ncbi:hypothetical protein QN382_03435 [Pseudomonas sp. 10B1]|uniref:hypothetical protein n=1 Tax=Pseudomonas sp. 10B1 TaxID=3048573 RepID=UPI002B232102|nr:hypothetical protein [Pseudomonas sp. 10B1]MEB0308337.1 hypothetical protein [Pseudomonas sp. 10B1]